MAILSQLTIAGQRFLLREGPIDEPSQREYSSASFEVSHEARLAIVENVTGVRWDRWDRGYADSADWLVESYPAGTCEFIHYV